MSRLAKIARSASSGTDTQFRKHEYGGNGIRDFLRDVLAMANATVEGPRYIVVGVDFDKNGKKRIKTVDSDDFSGKPSYQSLANEYIEPALRIRYEPVSIDGKKIGVFEIGDSQDRPYMMRIDYSEKLRRGDAYMRVNETAIKLGRRQLQELFESKFRDSVSAGDIEVGFPGEIIHKDLTLKCFDLKLLPSAEAGSKLAELIKIQSAARDHDSTNVMARLTHARLYGTDDPYVDRTPDELKDEMRQLRHKYRNEDLHYLYETNGERIQLVVCNQGQEPILDASLSIVMPNHNAFHVADRLPSVPTKNGFIERTPDEISAYPSVSLKDDSVQITSKVGDIPVGEPVEIFNSPVRICAGQELRGKRFGMRFSLHGQNLRTPAKGKLRLLFAK
jgi:hypothetical protein